MDERDDRMSAAATVDLAAALKRAFTMLGSGEISEAEREALNRRLIAITNAAKHDVERASERLDAWFADVEASLRG